MGIIIIVIMAKLYFLKKYIYMSPLYELFFLWSFYDVTFNDKIFVSLVSPKGIKSKKFNHEDNLEALVAMQILSIYNEIISTIKVCKSKPSLVQVDNKWHLATCQVMTKSGYVHWYVIGVFYHSWGNNIR